MKKAFSLMVALAIFCTGVSPARGTDYSADELLAKYVLAPEIAAVLDAHAEEINAAIEKATHTKKKMKHAIWQFSWLPGYYVKFHVNRVMGREMLLDAIRKHKLRLLTVPDKYVYHIPGRPRELASYNYLVVEPELSVKKSWEPFSLQEMQELCTLIKETGYADCNNGNFLRLTDTNQIVIVDTEMKNFSPKKYLGLLRLVIGYSRYNINTDFTQEAFKHLLDELRQALPKKPQKYAYYYAYLVEYFNGLKAPFAWDYQGYFESIF